MKKILFTLAAALFAAVKIQAQITPRIFLSHQGKTSMFNGVEVDKAIAASVDGDTIYLSEGTFAGPFNVDKKLSFIGAGQSTVLAGNFNVEIPDSTTLTSTLLQGVYINGSISVNKPVNNMILRKVKVSNSISLDHAMVSDAVFENCFIPNLYTSNATNHQMTVIGSWVEKVFNEAMHFSFVNCNIDNVSASSNFQGECINCIVYRSSGAKIPATFTNTLYGNNYNSSLITYVHCWTYPNNIYHFDYSTGKFNGDLTNYIGTDGTVVGYNGGVVPYTLEPSYPIVTGMETKVSGDSKTLNVNVKVRPHL